MKNRFSPTIMISCFQFRGVLKDVAAFYHHCSIYLWISSYDLDGSSQMQEIAYLCCSCAMHIGLSGDWWLEIGCVCTLEAFDGLDQTQRNISVF